MSGTTIKIIATILMIIDHFAGQFALGVQIPLFVIGKRSITVYYLIRLLTRIAFPLFAFGIVEGFRHTHDRRRYGLSLLMFALISEIPWDLVHHGSLIGPSQNVYFTLLLGYLALCLLEGQAKHKLTGLIVLFITSCCLSADYGARGFGFIVLLYLLDVAGSGRSMCEEVTAAIACSCVLNYPLEVALSFMIIHFYNGERGSAKGVSRYLFYIIYPLHLLVIWYLETL